MVVTFRVLVEQNHTVNVLQNQHKYAKIGYKTGRKVKKHHHDLLKQSNM